MKEREGERCNTSNEGRVREEGERERQCERDNTSSQGSRVRERGVGERERGNQLDGGVVSTADDPIGPPHHRR